MQHPDALIEIQKRSRDRVSYKGCASKVLAGVHIVAGLLSMALGIGAICTFASGYDTGYGIWAGFVFTLTGIFSACAGYHKNACILTTLLIMCMLSVFCGIVQFCMGVVATVNDRDRSDTGELSRHEHYLRYDIYYARNDPFRYLYRYHCTDTYGAFTWDSAWGPVDILLLLVGIIEAIVAMVSAILCCQSICCGLRKVYFMHRGVYAGTVSQSVYDGYAESRVSEPAILKVVPD